MSCRQAFCLLVSTTYVFRTLRWKRHFRWIVKWFLSILWKCFLSFIRLKFNHGSSVVRCATVWLLWVLNYGLGKVVVPLSPKLLTRPLQLVLEVPRFLIPEHLMLRLNLQRSYFIRLRLTYVYLGIRLFLARFTIWLIDLWLINLLTLMP